MGLLPVELVKGSANIVDVVSRYVPLEERGGTYWGLCPFHTEKTPSFSVSREKGVYYCFGCGAGGDVIDFVERVEGLGFSDAVRHLANLSGVDIGDSDDARSVLLSVWESISANRAPAERFLRDRGIDSDGVAVGYDSGEWTDAVDADVALKLGIGGRRGKGGKLFSWFRGRVVFPVRSGGTIIGLTGRIVSGRGPKWFHSNFRKKNTVFLLDERRRDIKDAGYVVVTEGPLDALKLQSAGIPAVAIFGNKLSDVQASRLAAIGVDIYLGLDRDGAGLAGTISAINTLRGRAIMRVVIWPEKYNDPGEIPVDEMIKIGEWAIPPAKFLYGYHRWKHSSLDRLLAALKPWLEPSNYADSIPTEIAAMLKRDGVVVPKNGSSGKKRPIRKPAPLEREKLLEADIAAVLVSVSDSQQRMELARRVEIEILPEPGDLLVGVLGAAKSPDPLSVFRQIGAGGIFYRRILEAPPYSLEEAKDKLQYLVRTLSIYKLERAVADAFERGDVESGVELAGALEAVKRLRRV